MNRRGFFGLLGAVVIATPALAELLEPKRTIFLPPKGGWKQLYQFNVIRSSGFDQKAFIYSDGLWVFGTTNTCAPAR